MTNTTIIKTVQTCEAGAFIKRIGSTTYHVDVHFSGTNTETAKDKILRLVKNEAATGKAANL